MKQTPHTQDRDRMQLLICLGELVLGILLLVNPAGFTTAVLWMAGVVLAGLGLFRLVGYWRTPPRLAAQGDGLTSGGLLLLAGLFCILGRRWVLAAFPLLTGVYGLLTLLNALGKLQFAVDLWRLGQKYWYVALTGAGLTLVFALVILANPFVTAALLWTFIALTLLAEAALDLAALLLGRRAS